MGRVDLIADKENPRRDRDARAGGFTGPGQPRLKGVLRADAHATHVGIEILIVAMDPRGRASAERSQEGTDRRADA